MTQFAVPLLVFKLTGSAVSLGIAAAAFGLPHLLFGLVIGAWTDRVDRKRLMIVVDVLSALLVASVPVAAAAGVLSVWWLYVVVFGAATLSIFFEASQFGAIPSLVGRDELVSANGRIQASFAAASVLGPLAAGALLVFLPVEDVLFVDAASFLCSAVMLSLIARAFNAPRERERTSIRADIVEGLRYVLRHPVLRNISAMMAMVNFVNAPVGRSSCYSPRRVTRRRTAKSASSSPRAARAWSCARWPPARSAGGGASGTLRWVR